MKQTAVERFRAWLARKALAYLTTQRVIRGFPVTVTNTRGDVDTNEVFKRLDQALELIEKYRPRMYRRLQHDVRAFVVRRYPCRGAFLQEVQECLVELTFTVNPQFTVAEVASCIVHEGTHARVRARGVRVAQADRGREERLCREAELEFGQVLPDGARVVGRAQGLLQLADADLAVNIDWREAQRRVDAADLETAPEWAKRLRKWRPGRTA